MLARRQLQSMESAQSFSASVDLSAKERLVDRYLGFLVQEEERWLAARGSLYPPAAPFVQSQPTIDASALFRDFILPMPKGLQTDAL
jgi:hypothetical protein